MTAEIVFAPHIPRTIYVQTIFDTETILKNFAKSTNAAQPTMLPTDTKTVMYMITNWKDHLSGQGTGNLEIQAEVNDIINWRTMSLSNNTGEAAIFYQFVVPADGVLRAPELCESQVTVPIPVVTNPAPYYNPPYDYKMETVTDVYWYSIIRKPGYSFYRICFFILAQDPDTRKLVRYFYTWDPKVTVIG